MLHLNDLYAMPKVGFNLNTLRSRLNVRFSLGLFDLTVLPFRRSEKHCRIAVIVPNSRSKLPVEAMLGMTIVHLL